MPEIDLAHAKVLGRGRHVERARRSFETVIVDKKTSNALGGPDAIVRILQALAESIVAPPRKKRRAA